MQERAAEGATMQTFKQLGLCAVATAFVAVTGCTKHESNEPATARNNYAPMGSNDMNGAMTPASRSRSAAEQIAQSRCDRERECGNIGKDQTFSSLQDCLTRIQNDWKDELNARECPGGINQQELNECLTEVRSEACGNPFDTLARMTECTSGQICIEKR
jgi:hypothetical protein